MDVRIYLNLKRTTQNTHARTRKKKEKRMNKVCALTQLLIFFSLSLPRHHTGRTQMEYSFVFRIFSHKFFFRIRLFMPHAKRYQQESFKARQYERNEEEQQLCFIWSEKRNGKIITLNIRSMNANVSALAKSNSNNAAMDDFTCLRTRITHHCTSIMHCYWNVFG